MSIQFITPYQIIEYNVGDKRPPHSHEDITSVRAIGEGLGIILSYFNNIPGVRCTRDYTVWTGDFAKFIYINFPYHYYNK